LRRVDNARGSGLRVNAIEQADRAQLLGARCRVDVGRKAQQHKTTQHLLGRIERLARLAPSNSLERHRHQGDGPLNSAKRGGCGQS
jgi:hypothetical protein